jgi:hypothetical protein
VDRDKKDFSIGGLTMKYTCEDYRSEMRLMALRKRLEEEDLSKAEKARIVKEIENLEEDMEIS